jgi:cell division protein FtsZ
MQVDRTVVVAVSIVWWFVAVLLPISVCRGFSASSSLWHKHQKQHTSGFWVQRPRTAKSEGSFRRWIDPCSSVASALSVSSSRRMASLDKEERSAPQSPPCIIKVIGVGGGGGNAVNHMVRVQGEQQGHSLAGVEYWSLNTDAQALAQSLLAPSHRLQIGQSVTRGLGAGGDPARGAEAAQEASAEIKRIVHGADLVFVTCGMGGGTGSGAAPIVADIAKNECNCLTVGVVTKPFAFEGRRRLNQANEAIEIMRNHVDTLIVVSNDKLLQIVPPEAPMTQAFATADDVLRSGVIGIAEIILRTGLVNVDFADVRAVMKDAGAALLGLGRGSGPDRATDAALAAIRSPLLDCPIVQAKRVVFNIYGGPDLRLSEINAASEVIYQNCDENANIIFGALIDEEMGDDVSVTVLACDFNAAKMALPTPTTPSFPLPLTQSVIPAASAQQQAMPTVETSRNPTETVYNEAPRIPIKRGFKRPAETKVQKGGLFRNILGK